MNLQSFQDWADAHVARCEAAFDLRVREYLRNGGDASPEALLAFASCDGHQEKELQDVK